MNFLGVGDSAVLNNGNVTCACLNRGFLISVQFIYEGPKNKVMKPCIDLYTYGDIKYRALLFGLF